MLKIGINGFGRIGRALCRIALDDPGLEVVAINDIDPLVENHAYLLKYDSVYGRLDRDIKGADGRLTVDGHAMQVFCEREINDVRWADTGAQVVIDASGVARNVELSHNVVGDRVSHVVVTHAAKEGLDATYVPGVNAATIDKDKHRVVGSSICDVNGTAPLLRHLEDRFGIESGFVTTLHPWLAYQNLTDGSIRSVSNPGHYWTDFSLGRASTLSLIPKNTTLVPALSAVMPDIAAKLHAMSFRVPTLIVSAADVTLTMSRDVTREELESAIVELEEAHPTVVNYCRENLVSIDYSKRPESINVDSRWLHVIGGRSVKLVTWYDNEWAYAQRVADVATFLGAG